MAFFIGGAAGAAIGGALVSTVGGALLADDNGAESANNAAADSNRLQGEIARDQWNRYKEIYEPLERGVVAEAQNYGTPENYARAAGDASATVSSQFGKARDRLSRTPGLDPSSAGYASSMIGLDLAQAASDATQQNAARQKVTDTAFARKTDALSLGKGLPASASSMLSTSASNNMAQARYGSGLAMDQAQGFGTAVNRVFSNPAVGNWLGNLSQPSFTSDQIVRANSWNVPQTQQPFEL